MQSGMLFETTTKMVDSDVIISCLPSTEIENNMSNSYSRGPCISHSMFLESSLIFLHTEPSHPQKSRLTR